MAALHQIALAGAAALLIVGHGRVAPASAQSATPQTVAEAAAPAQPATPATLVSQRLTSLAVRSDHADDVAALQRYYADNPDKLLWIAGGVFHARARSVLDEIARADDWGLTSSSFSLPTLAPNADLDAQIAAEARLSLAVMKYARHARGGRFDPSKITEALDRQPNLLPSANVINAIAAASEPDSYLRKLHPQHQQFEKLRQLFLLARAGKLEAPVQPVIEETPQQPAKGRKRKAAAKPPAPPPAVTAERILINMEQWRWMPDDLGSLHVMVNIPEYQLRMFKNGKQIYTERVVTGTAANQTPIFSKDLETVVFQPGWGVPSGIKVKELLPGLLAGRDPISSKGLVVRHRGREVSPHSIDWRTTDIRRVSIVQPPGPSNALGQVKFLFPNKHDVYMHDTPAKSLFNASTRAFSHGCVRVRNPMRFAEVIFAETDGWSAQRVASLSRGKPENEVSVSSRLDVHLTYFTLVVDDEGKPQTFRDVYSHEPRIRAGLEGRAEQVAKKTEDLGALRQQLVGSVRNVRVARADRDEPEARRSAQPRRQSREVRRSSAPANRGGGGWFNFF